MSVLSFGSTPVTNGQVVSLSVAKMASPTIDFPFDEGKIYLIALYDATKFLWFRSGDIDYLPYNPDYQNGMNYFLDIYETPNRVRLGFSSESPSQRLSRFSNNLVSRTMFRTVVTVPSPSPLPSSPMGELGKGRENIAYHGTQRFVHPNPLDSQQEKFCSCRLQVLAKGGVTSPDAVCRNSTGGYHQQCWRYYAWDRLPDNEIQAYAQTHSIAIPSPYNRASMLANMHAWLASK